jgi:hypothetical protein
MIYHLAKRSLLIRRPKLWLFSLSGILILVMGCHSGGIDKAPCGCDGKTTMTYSNLKGSVKLLDGISLYGIQVDSITPQLTVIPCDTSAITIALRKDGTAVRFDSEIKVDCALPNTPNAIWLHYGHLAKVTKVQKQ